jgi:hypothetical protein
MNLVVTGVRIVHHETVEVANYMICSTRVQVPSWIDACRGCNSRSPMF